MKFERKYIFTGKEDFKMLRAVKKLIGEISKNDAMEYGLTKEECILYEEFYTLIKEDIILEN